MKTRQARIDPVHVAALNLIDLEFFDSKPVRSTYKSYARNLNSHYPSEPEALNRHLNEGSGLFLELLREIARDLGYEFDKDDLNRLGYLPIGLGKQHENAMANAHLLRELLEGSRSIHIINKTPDDPEHP